MHDTPELHDDATAPVRQLVGVRLREGARADDYLAEDLTLHVGDHCVVEVPSGHAIGQVRRPARDVPASKRDRTYPHVLRLATPDEVTELRRRREREVDAIRTCQLRARGRGLELKVVDVEITHDGRRVPCSSPPSRGSTFASWCGTWPGSSAPASRCDRSARAT